MMKMMYKMKTLAALLLGTALTVTAVTAAMPLTARADSFWDTYDWSYDVDGLTDDQIANSLPEFIQNFTATPGDGCVTLSWEPTGLDLDWATAWLEATTDNIAADPEMVWNVDVNYIQPNPPVDGAMEDVVEFYNTVDGMLLTSYTWNGLTNGETYYFVIRTNYLDDILYVSAVPGSGAVSEPAPAAEETAAAETAAAETPAVETAAEETPAAPAAMTNEDIAKEIIQKGNWGVGKERKARLAAAGYDPAAVQAIINQMMKQ